MGIHRTNSSKWTNMAKVQVRKRSGEGKLEHGPCLDFRDQGPMVHGPCPDFRDQGPMVHDPCPDFRDQGPMVSISSFL